MIAPMHINNLILWDYTYRAFEFMPFLCMGDHGPFCPVKFEAL